MKKKDDKKTKTQYSDAVRKNISDSNIMPEIVVQMSEDEESVIELQQQQQNINLKVPKREHRNYMLKFQTSGNKEPSTNNRYLVEKINKPNRDEEGFEKVQRRRPKRLGTTRVSKEEEKTGFVGAERRAWIYLYRIKRHVTAEQVEQHIRKNSSFANESIKVKELPSDSKQLKSFLLTAPLEKKDELYDPSLWPQNAGVKRFNYGLFQKYKPGADFL